MSTESIQPKTATIGRGEVVVCRFNLAAEIQKILISTPAFVHDPKGAADMAFKHADALLVASGVSWED